MSTRFACKTLACAAAIASLAACGGGGGGDNATAIAFTTANYQALGVDLLGPVFHLPYLIGAATRSMKDDARLPGTSAATALCSGAGTRNQTYPPATSAVAGGVNVAYNDCVEGAMKKTGRQSIELTKIATGGYQIEHANTDYTVADSANHVSHTSNFSATLTAGPDFLALPIKSSQMIFASVRQDVSSSMKITNYAANNTKTDAGDITTTSSGTLSGSIKGYENVGMTFATNSSFSYTAGSKYPVFGQMTFSGAKNSRLIFRINGNDGFTLSVDENGDGINEATVNKPWTALTPN